MSQRPPSKPGIDLPFALQPRELEQSELHRKLARCGDDCPQCGAGRLDFDGLLNLSCPNCGYSAEGGCYT